MVPCVAVYCQAKGVLLAALLLVAIALPVLADAPSDMQKALGLVPRSDATIKAVRSANWSDPATWGGRLPADGDRVWIPQGVEVRQDVDSPRLQWLRLDGDLFPAPVGVPTNAIALNLDTLVTTMTSKLYTPEGYAGQWNIVFTDEGPLDTLADPWAFGRGAQLMGTIDLHGREVTGYQFTTGNKPGDTKITLKNPVTGWRVGDKLVLPGVGIEWLKSQALKDDDDVCTIAALDGNVITLDEPLKFDHGAVNRYGDPRPMFVANISPRGIDFKSENPQFDRRGHVMVMRDDLMMQQDFFYCSFRDLGRTDKSRNATDPDGKGGGLDNPRARYALHYHRCKPDRWQDDARTIPSMEGRVFGCMVHGSPGWGFVNHDSFVCIQHNVAYDVDGSHYSAEIGSETGCFTSNVAIRSHNTYGKGRITEKRVNKNDWGKYGHGFWTHGGSLKMEGNIVTGCPSTAFEAMGEGFNPGNEKTPGAVFFAVKNLAEGERVTSPPPGWPYQGKYLATIWVPQHYKGLSVWGCPRGIQYWGINPLKSRNPVVAKSSIKDCYLECPSGIRFGYASHVEIEGNKYYSHVANYSGGIFFTHNSGAGSNYFRRNTIRGAKQGMFVPVEGKVEISDCRFDAKLGLKITTPADVSRKLTLSNLTFDPVPGATNIYARLGDNSGLMVDQVAGGWTRALRPYGYGDLQESDTTTLNGKFLYYAEEGPDFKLSEFKSMPDILKGLTTRQLREQHHIGMLSRYAAEDAAVLPGSTCVVGSPPTLLPYFRVNQNWKAVYDSQTQKTNVMQGFVLKVQEGRADGKAGAWIELPPQNLQTGWQVLEVQASGVPRGVLVFCDPQSSPAAAWPEPPATLNVAR